MRSNLCIKMKLVNSLIGFILTLSVANSLPAEDVTIPFPTTDKFNVYVLLVPNTKPASGGHLRAPQDDGDGEGSAFSETGAYVGQIIRGVLGGNVSTIFAGGVSFIPNADVSEGVSTILANVAPTVTSIMKHWGNRFAHVLGITSTIRPGSFNYPILPLNSTVSGGQPSAQPAVPQYQPQLITTPYPAIVPTTVEDNEEESDTVHVVPT